MTNPQITERCRNKLIEIASKRDRQTITYGELAKFLGVTNQSVGKYLNPIYREEIAQGRPDLTVVVVYSPTGMGRYNSAGGPVQSIMVDPNNPSHVRAYKAELKKVFDYWPHK